MLRFLVWQHREGNTFSRKCLSQGCLCFSLIAPVACNWAQRVRMYLDTDGDLIGESISIEVCTLAGSQLHPHAKEKKLYSGPHQPWIWSIHCRQRWGWETKERAGTPMPATRSKPKETTSLFIQLEHITSWQPGWEWKDIKCQFIRT